MLDADISRFLDTVSHDWLIRFLERRIGDKRAIRLIEKWLKAGCMEEGAARPSEEGAPQGAVVSPLLADICLHYVFDLWARQWRARHAYGNMMILIRHADDIVVGFEKAFDAKRFLAALRERMEQFSLSLHPEKTRLLEFGRFVGGQPRQAWRGQTGDLYIPRLHARLWTEPLVRRTRRDRMLARLREIKDELRQRMRQSIPELGKWLRQVVRGYYAYHAAHTNGKRMSAFRFHATNLWRRTLRRRSRKDRTLWDRMARIVDAWLPVPRILHPWPEARFAAKHPRWEPGA